MERVILFGFRTYSKMLRVDSPAPVPFLARRFFRPEALSYISAVRLSS